MLCAITVHQPWASAIAYGPKRVENRFWAPRERLPMWLAIHAGTGGQDAFREGMDAIRDVWPQSWDAEFPRGAIVAVAELVLVMDGETARRSGDPSISDWAVGPVCWVFDEVVALPEPVECRGQRGLWVVEEPWLSRVRAGFRAARAAGPCEARV